MNNSYARSSSIPQRYEKYPDYASDSAYKLLCINKLYSIAIHFAHLHTVDYEALSEISHVRPAYLAAAGYFVEYGLLELSLNRTLFIENIETPPIMQKLYYLT